MNMRELRDFNRAESHDKRKRTNQWDKVAFFKKCFEKKFNFLENFLIIFLRVARISLFKVHRIGLPFKYYILYYYY